MSVVETFAVAITLAVGAATLTDGAEPYPVPPVATAIPVILSTPATASAAVIPKIVPSI